MDTVVWRNRLGLDRILFDRRLRVLFILAVTDTD
jgi:hypothetical protein